MSKAQYYFLELHLSLPQAWKSCRLTPFCNILARYNPFVQPFIKIRPNLFLFFLFLLQSQTTLRGFSPLKQALLLTFQAINHHFSQYFYSLDLKVCKYCYKPSNIDQHNFIYNFYITKQLSPMSDMPQSNSMQDSPSVSQFSSQNQKINQRRAKLVSKKHLNKKKRNLYSEKNYQVPFIYTYKTSLWKLSENIAYMNFLLENEELFYTSRLQRKAIKINVLMSAAIKTRSPDQCRSHHQKMIKYHRDIPNIITHIRSLATKEQEGKKQPSSPVVQEIPLEPPQASLPEAQNAFIDAILEPQFDWESWIDQNYLIEQQRQLELWLEGVQDKYGNLS